MDLAFSIMSSLGLGAIVAWWIYDDNRQIPLSEWSAGSLRIFKFNRRLHETCSRRGSLSKKEWFAETRKQSKIIDSELKRRGIRSISKSWRDIPPGLRAVIVGSFFIAVLFLIQI